MATIIRTQGNTQQVYLPLMQRALHYDGTITTEPYTPSADDDIVVTLQGLRQYRYKSPAIQGNGIVFRLYGTEVASMYAMEVTIVQPTGNRLRFWCKDALQLTHRTTYDNGQGEDAETEGIILDASWFFFAQGEQGEAGEDGADGRGISNIHKTGGMGNVDYYMIDYTDGTFTQFNVTNGTNGTDGADGADGRGITSITKTGSIGLVDSYRIGYTDGTMSFFNVTNGADGTSINVVQSTGASTEDVMSQNATTLALAGKAEVVRVYQSYADMTADTQNHGQLCYVSDVNIFYIYDGLDGGSYNQLPNQIVQSTGASTENVMSQKAVTDIIGDIETLLAAL